MKQEYVQLPSGLVVPEHIAEDVARSMLRPICVDLFAGCGGFSLGMIRGGFQVVAACDNDPTATITYLTNLGHYPMKMHFLSDKDEARFARELEKSMGRRKDGITVPLVSGSNRCSSEPGVQHFFFGDVRRLKGRMILDALELERGEIDCVVGGPPCQGYSTAGRRDVMDPRNSLVFEFGRLVLELMPRTMCMENVPGILSMVTEDGIPVMDALCLMLDRGGYGTYDALRMALTGEPGRRGAVRSRRRGEEETPEPPEAPRQQELAL